jgi:peptidyl-prolyl cis-trans isomerase SurA
MTLLKRSVATLLLSCLVVFFALGQPKPDKSEALFSINKKPVTTDEFVYLYTKNHQHKPEEFTADKIEEYLKLFINYKLKVEEALNRGYDTTAAFRKEYNGYRDELLKPYLPDARVVDSLVKISYDRMKEEVKVSHILITLKPDASPADTLKAWQEIMNLSKRILNGEDFGTLAMAYSQEPGAKETKGNLGYFTALQMVFAFEQAAYKTPVGELSKPVRTRFGYHILKVLDRRPSRGEVEVSHIMIRTGQGIDNKKAKDRIFDIYDQLQKGVKWEELCEQYSEDPNSKDNGGRLRPFGVGAMAMIPEFEEMAFALNKKGDISDPFESQYGWHILRLESKIPLPPFDELKASLTSRVSRDERVQISRQALRDKMKRESGFTENTVVKSKLLSLADSSLTKGTWNPSFDKNRAEEVLFTLEKQPFRVKDFLSYIKSNHAVTGLAPEQYLVQLYENYVEASLVRLMEQKIKTASPDYKWLLKEYYEGILLFEIMEKEVWNKATEDTVGQRNFYHGHMASYTAKDRIAGKIYSSPSRDLLLQLQKLLAENDTTAGAFAAKNKIRQEGGAFEKTDRPVLAKINWTPGLQIAENNGSYYLVSVNNLLPPGQKSFNEARSSVISDYQTYLEDSWIRQLSKKYKVKVYQKIKKQTFGELMK